MLLSADKIKAFSIHLSISATIVGFVFVLIFFFWYPKSFFEANGAWGIVRILIVVDLVMGPSLTLILFKKGKKGLVMDMCIIVAIQLSALVYGTTVIFGARPYYLVFAVDRFEIVGKSEIDSTKIVHPELTVKPNKGPILVYTELPKDPEEATKLMFETVMEGAPDIDRRPEYYQLYRPNVDKVLQQAKKITELVKIDEKNKKEVEKFLKKHPTQIDDLLYLPLKGRNKFIALVIDKTTGLPIDGISVDPWPKQ